MKSLKVSVVMSCYNCEKFVEIAIKTIVKQTYKNWELVIVDDFSQDDSVKVINNAITKFNIKDKVKLITHNQNFGCGTSLSDAINNSTGELIAVVDSDDALSTKDALEKMVNAHLKHPEASLVYSDYWECNEDLSKKVMFRTRQIKNDETYLGTKIRISHLKVFKKSFYDKTPGVNRNLRQTVDKDLVLKLEEVGKMIHIPEALYFYRQRRNNLTKSTAKKNKEYRTFVKIMRYKVYNDARARRGHKLKNVGEIKEWEKNNPNCG